VQSESRRKNPKILNIHFICILLANIIEWSAALDFYSDIVVVSELAQSTDTAWLTFSLFTIIAPYYTIYTSLINYQIRLMQEQHSNAATTYCKLIGNCLLVLPTMLVFLVAMDIIYIAIQIIALPLLLPLSLTNKSAWIIDKFHDW